MSADWVITLILAGLVGPLQRWWTEAPAWQFWLAGGAAAVLVALVWRFAHRRLLARRLGRSLRDPSPDRRRAAVTVACEQGLRPHARRLLALADVEAEPSVRAALVAAVLRNAWEPADRRAILELRLWAHRAAAELSAIPSLPPAEGQRGTRHDTVRPAAPAEPGCHEGGFPVATGHEGGFAVMSGGPAGPVGSGMWPCGAAPGSAAVPATRPTGTLPTAADPVPTGTAVVLNDNSGSEDVLAPPPDDDHSPRHAAPAASPTVPVVVRPGGRRRAPSESPIPAMAAEGER